MRCPRCRHDNSAEARFCGQCGNRLGRPVCTRCGTPSPPDHRFCGACGEPLPAAAAASRGPRTYTPAHLARRIEGARQSILGERKHVTVLFADVRGSLELLSGRDPEDARRLLDAVTDRMMEAVHRYEGTVNQVLGDGIMALFGAPIALEDHSVRACFAALRMLESVARYGEEARRRQGLDVQIRVGLSSGEVVVHEVRSDLRMEFAAVGRVVHLASRMEQLARPGTALLTRDTARLAAGYVGLRSLGPVPVRGMPEAEEIFELAGAVAPRSRLQVAAARGLTRLVGREGPLAELRRGAERAAAGHGQLVAVCGEPGVGKSRLLHEFVHTHLAEPWRVLETGAAPWGDRAPYQPIIGALRRLLGIEGSDDAPRIRQKVTAGLLALDEHRQSTLFPVLGLLDASIPGSRWEELDPPQRQAQIRDAVKRLLLRESRLHPVCFVLEDLHGIDPESEAVLGVLLDALPAARILILVSYRPEYQHGWANRSHYTQIRLDPLEPPRAEELVAELLGADPGLDPLRRRLIERTEGNPFFLEESVRHLAGMGVLRGEAGEYRLAGTAGEPEMPGTVQAVLAARVDRLAPEDKQLLQAAAVIGRDVPLTLLEAVVDRPEDDLAQALSHLREAGLLQERVLFPEIEYSFRHALIHEVVYETLLRQQRQALDARVVAAIEGTAPDRLGDHLDRLAHHAYRGEVWDKALVFCREAGARAFSRSALRAAVGAFDRALAALERLPSSPETVVQGIDLRLDLRNALSPLGEYPRMLAVLTEAEQLAGSIHDRSRLGLVSAFLVNFYTLRGELERALAHGQQALDIAATTSHLPLSVLTHAFLALTRWAAGNYREAIELAGRNVRQLAGPLAHERFGMAHLPAVYSRTVMAWSRAELGEFDDGEAVAEEGLRIADLAEHPHSRIFASLGLGVLHLRRGEFDRAIAVLERARTVWEATDLPAVFLELALPLASAYARSGRALEAIALVEEAVARALALGHRLGHWLRTGGLAEAYLCAGRVEEALPLAELNIQVARIAGMQGACAWALCLRAEAEAAQDPPRAVEAEATYREALALGEQLGMRPLQAQCRLGLGRLHRGLGREGDARRELAGAAEAFRALGMNAWLARAGSVP